VNAVFAREREWSTIKPAGVKKKVAIVGGGPAGMEAARLASLRGHAVTLYEKGMALGGQLLLAAAPPGKRRLLWVRDYLATQLGKQGVKVNFGVEVTPELLGKENTEVVIIATGATPVEPDFIDTDDDRVVNAWDILGGLIEPQNQKVVVLGGNMLGCEVAEFISQKGNLVSVIKMRPGSAMAEDCEPTNRRGLLDSLQACTVNLLSNYKVEGLTDDGVKVVKRDSGEELTLEAETIVLALGSKPDQALVNALQKEDTTFYHIGDCREPKNIRQAIYEGALIGRQI
ncbi:hypothetical protein LCGC14_2160810, partial [marine sediment metagenome]